MEHLFELIEHTNRSIFLTGRAGTGKTTFLQTFVQKTAKKFAIVAPTGIAAINAGGVTIHSMFGLPLTTFVPTTTFIDPNSAINIPNLLPHFKYRREKLKLLRTLEVLIIDEVSMLRCDVLDMMDMALRTTRRSPLRFGGLQVLFIGDLYQLPPVVKSETEGMLYSYYASPFFFEAKALDGLQLLTISLTKVYRQTDAAFLNLLNAIRDNEVEKINFDLLHSRFLPDFEPESFFVHLVSHNYMADTINKQQMNKLKGKARSYKAVITGDFKQHLFPNNEELELKEGAQVMFIRNDKDEVKRFYNGKLATIIKLKEEEVVVVPQNETKELTIAREVWENKKYYVNHENKIEEDVVGSYQQFPFKLAWAVTIHKSQGLTFDKVIIDAGKSFTSGQVYVALSRCRTLEGIVLKSTIPPHAIINDSRIHNFQKETEANDRVLEIIQSEQYHYIGDRLLRIIGVQELLGDARDWEEAIHESKVLDSENVLDNCKKILDTLTELEDVFEKFAVFLKNRIQEYTQSANGWDLIEGKSKGAVNFFYRKINEEVFVLAKECYSETKGTKGLKGYNEVLKKFVDTVTAYLNTLRDARLMDTVLFEGDSTVSVKVDIAKKPTHIITYQYFEEGKTPKEIAVLRNVTEGTILTHLAKIASVGILDIQKLFSEEQIKLFKDKYQSHQFKSLTEWKTALPDSFDYNEIRILLNHFNYQRSQK